MKGIARSPPNLQTLPNRLKVLAEPRVSKTPGATWLNMPPINFWRASATPCACSLSICAIPACPALPDGGQLPLLLLNGEVFSSGGKISVPAIRKRLEASGGVTDD